MAPDRDDYGGPERRGGGRDYVEWLEERVRTLELRSVRQTSRLEGIEQREADAIAAVRQLASDVRALQRAEVVEQSVQHALEQSDVRGWGRRERIFALLGAAGVVVSLGLQAVNALGGH